MYNRIKTYSKIFRIVEYKTQMYENECGNKYSSVIISLIIVVSIPLAMAAIHSCQLLFHITSIFLAFCLRQLMQLNRTSPKWGEKITGKHCYTSIKYRLLLI